MEKKNETARVKLAQRFQRFIYWPYIILRSVNPIFILSDDVHICKVKLVDAIFGVWWIF